MKKVLYGQQARKKILDGISKLTKAVRITLGGEGRNVIFRNVIVEPNGRRHPGFPESTRDGVTVAREFDSEDPFEKMGSDLLKAIALKTNYDTGDGTSTAIVLAEEMVKRGFEEIENKKWWQFWKKRVSPVELSVSLKEKSKDIILQLKKQAKKIKGKEQLSFVGTIASRSKEMGDMVADIITKIGAEGAVDIQDMNGPGTSIDIVDGLKINNGYMSPYFATEPRKMLAEHENAQVLVTDLRITTIDDLLPLLRKMEIAKSEKELVIITDQIGYGVMSILVQNHIQNQFRFLVVRLPGPVERLDEFRDIAAFTGATFISEDTGLDLSQAGPEHLGIADRIVCNMEETLIIGGGGDKKEIKDKIAALKTEHDIIKDPEERKRFERRIGQLSGGIAVIRVGGGSAFEQLENKYMVEDAVCAVRSAVRDGVIDGGGLPLARIAQKLESDSAVNRILKKALMVPFEQIVQNGGWDSKEININSGYDISNKKTGDMFKMGIIDPVNVTITAFENAVSVAAKILITETIIADIENGGTQFK